MVKVLQLQWNGIRRKLRSRELGTIQIGTALGKVPPSFSAKIGTRLFGF